MPDVALVEIGSRIAVYWPLDNRYYDATVSRVRDKTRPLHFLEYDDGESEWLDLSLNKFRILSGGTRRRRDDEILDDDSVLSASNDDLFELASQASADEYNPDENHFRISPENSLERASFRRVLQGNKRRRLHGKESGLNSETGTPQHKKMNPSINLDYALSKHTLFRQPSADLSQVAEFVERLVGQTIKDSSGTNRNSSIEKATKEASKTIRNSSIKRAKMEISGTKRNFPIDNGTLGKHLKVTKVSFEKKRKYPIENTTKETLRKELKATSETLPKKQSVTKEKPGKKRKYRIEKTTKDTPVENHKSSIEKATKDTSGKKRKHPNEKATKETSEQKEKLIATEDIPRKKQKYSTGTKVRKVRSRCEVNIRNMIAP
jgi:hypothetical protein